MKKIFKKAHIIFIVLFCVLLTACQSSSKDSQEECQSELQEQPLEETSASLQVMEEKQELIEKTIEQPSSQETIKKATVLDFKFPDDVFIIEVSRNYNDDQEAITLKDELLQLWINGNMVCEKQIPPPAKVSIGSNFYEVIGNPYISNDGRLVLIQSYTNPKDEHKLDYTILAKNCSKVIPSLNYNGYVFQNYEGKYGLVFYDGNIQTIGYPYEGFGFNTVDNNYTFPKPTIIWLNESTVKSVNFGSWGSSMYGYQEIWGISARLDVESYGQLDISHACDSFEPVEINDNFFYLLHEKFTPEEYNERFSKYWSEWHRYLQLFHFLTKISITNNILAQIYLYVSKK